MGPSDRRERPAAASRSIAKNQQLAAAGIACVVSGAALIDRGGFNRPGAVAVGMLAAAVVVRRPATPRRDEVWALMALAALASWWLARGIITNRTDHSVGLLSALACFCCAYWVARHVWFWRPSYVVWWVLALALATVASGLVGVLTQTSPLAQSAQRVWRLAGPLSYANAAGLLAAMGLLIALSLRPGRRRSLVAAFLSGGLAASLSRAAVLGVAAGGWLLRHRLPRPATLAAGALLGVAVALLASPLGAGSVFASRTVNSRSLVWEAGWRQLRGHLLLGAGPDVPARVSYHGHLQAVAYMHSEYLQVLVGGGLIGAAMLAASALLVARLACSGGPAGVYGRAALLAFAVTSALDFSWRLPVLVIAAGACLAIASSCAPAGPAAAPERVERTLDGRPGPAN